MDYRPEELLIAVIARLLDGLRHIAVGVLADPGLGGAARPGALRRADQGLDHRQP